MLGHVAFWLPIGVTTSLFLILFNNWNNGLLILLICVGMNLSLLSVRLGCKGHFLASARAGAMCVLSIVTTVLAIEMLFPYCLPRDHAEIRDLTKGFVGSQPSPSASVVFMNEDQITGRSHGLQDLQGVDHRSWHNPGGKFAYYGYDPNLKASYVNLFHWNAAGYYDHDYQPEKSDGVFRIAVIGDSYVEAVQVPLSRSFHKLIEASFNQDPRVMSAERFQVLALGNSGTGQVSHYRVLREQAMKYRPNLVVLALSSNDFCDDDPELRKELILSSGAITPLIRTLTRHDYFAMAFAVRRLQDLKRNRIAISPELLQWSSQDLPSIENAWKRTLGHIKLSWDFCRSRGIGFLLFYVGCDLEVKYLIDPHRTISQLKAMGIPHRKIQWDMERSVRRVEEFCRTHSIPFVSLLDSLAAAQRQTGHQVFGDHYTIFGHQVAAQVLTCAVASTLNDATSLALSQRACLAQDFRHESQPIGAVASSTFPAGVRLVPATGASTESR